MLRTQLTRAMTTKHTYEMDWDNMSPSDWEIIEKRGERLGFINEAYGGSPATFRHGNLTNELRYSMPTEETGRKLFEDMVAHENEWMNDIFNPLEADKIPSNCERTVIALTYYADILLQQERHQEAGPVIDMCKKSLAKLYVQYYENPKFLMGAAPQRRYQELKERLDQVEMVLNKQCFACQTTSNDLKQCSRCHCALYCSVKCQTAHWPLHKQVCKARAQDREEMKKPAGEGLSSYLAA